MRTIRNLVAATALLISGSVFGGEPVNINAADAEALAGAIHGVGSKKAAAIIEYRKQHGPFESVDELTRVRGIGQKLIDKSRQNLTVGSAGS